LGRLIEGSRLLSPIRRENNRFLRLLGVLLCVFYVFSMAGLANAQSHPGWWTVVPPESRSLVGMEWQTLQNSPFGEVLRGELSSGGGIALPDLPCLMNAHDFLIASPPLLAAANGGCSPGTLRTEAQAHGLKLSIYRGFEIWGPGMSRSTSSTESTSNAGEPTLSVVQFNERVVLIGSVKSLRAAIDRSLAETRTYSPLLIQGARLARTRDLWAVATELPDPLASIFVPLEVTAGSVRNFEGGITLHEGLELGATLDAGSEAVAAAVAGSIRQSIPQFSAVAKGLQVTTDGSSVTLGLQVANDVLRASLRRGGAEVPLESEPPVMLAAPLAPQPLPPPASKASAVGPESKGSAVPSTPTAPASTAAVEPAKPEPQIIRIYGLDEGPREIVLRPKEP